MLAKCREIASTHPEVAAQRAAHLKDKQVTRVLELCVGPSLPTLEAAYGQQNISVVGNDIDPSWRRSYSSGHWIIGDALQISYQGFDGVVFAPPLSRDCSGKREDSLMVNQVVPSYVSFLDKIQREDYAGVAVLVLPARSFASRMDREQFHGLMHRVYNVTDKCTVAPMTVGRRKIRKYVEIYFQTG